MTTYITALEYMSTYDGLNNDWNDGQNKTQSRSEETWMESNEKGSYKLTILLLVNKLLPQLL